MNVLTGLSAVSEYAVPANGTAVRRLLALALRFEEGVLVVEALPETDECSMRLLTDALLRHDDAEAEWSDVSRSQPWSRFIGGGTSLWRWTLVNQGRYTDGAQVHLVSRGDLDDEVEVQWLVEASTLRGSLLTPLQPRG